MRDGSANRFRRIAPALAAAALIVGLIGARPLPARAAARRAPSAKQQAMQRAWSQKLRLDVEGETVADLLSQIAQQLLMHITTDDELAREPLAAFAGECTLGDLRDALADLFPVTLSAYDNAESLQFTLWEDPDVRKAALSQGAASAKPAATRPAPPAPAAADPELLKPLVIPNDLRPIEEEDLFLPAIQQRLAKIAGIRIFSDYADRTEDSLGSQSAEAFFRSLNGLPLRDALDRVAAKFNYTWRKSHGWYLFRSRTWKADRQARVAEAKKAAEEDGDTFNP